MNILAIKGSDESDVQLGNDGMRHLIAAMFDVFDLLHAGGNVFHLEQECVHGLRAVIQVGAHLGKHLEKFGFSGDEAKLQSGLRRLLSSVARRVACGMIAKPTNISRAQESVKPAPHNRDGIKSKKPHIAAFAFPSRKVYSVDSISKPQASSRDSGMNF